ncbi:hypothetical protein G9C98_006812 [Cotesia typhae]|uniref:Protein kinase domain-containing protein n=1 Tax=Cotesia typhae TaxID=2053667 RepID=A0A8J5QQ76_9HYME|nr:hypothetical protein G9C98_006812 [Cotesia typhae]
MGGHHSRSVPTPGEEVNFNHFQVLRAIGKGSFGKVCIVEKGERSGKMYAMKYVHKSECAMRGALKNVTREVEIMSKLEHPFLVNLWFSFQDEEDLFMVTDLLLGGDLRYHIQQQVHFSEDSIILFIAEIALALDYLKSRRIIHRDIKPDNILLDEEGHAHVTDFNVATQLEDDQLATSISGTKPYIAPEIYMCSCEVHGGFQSGYGYTVDWWSLGILAWETLEGVRPFPIHSGTSYKEALRILQASIDCRPVHPTEWSQSMSQLLNSLLTLDPNQRLTTLCQLKQLQAMNKLDFDRVYLKQVKPIFTPSKNHLNCDPTFELEEMIIEARPLHKKKKRLAKQRSLRSQELADQVESPAIVSGPTSSIPSQDPTGLVFIPDFPVDPDRDKQRSHSNQHFRNSSRLSVSSSNIHSRIERTSLRSNKRSGIATSLDIDFIDASPETSTS